MRRVAAMARRYSASEGTSYRKEAVLFFTYQPKISSTLAASAGFAGRSNTKRAGSKEAARASFSALGSFFSAASRRRAALLSGSASAQARLAAPKARVYLAPLPLWWAARRRSRSLVQPV